MGPFVRFITITGDGWRQNLLGGRRWSTTDTAWLKRKTWNVKRGSWGGIPWVGQMTGWGWVKGCCANGWGGRVGEWASQRMGGREFGFVWSKNSVRGERETGVLERWKGFGDVAVALFWECVCCSLFVVCCARRWRCCAN